MKIVARTAGDPMAVVGPIRALLTDLDPDIPLYGIASMNDLIDDSVADRKTITLSLTLYAALPLIMAAVGTYAVLTYSVTRRFHELGIRMAIGASAARIGWSVLGRGISLVGAGLVVGTIAALGGTRWLRQMLSYSARASS